MLSVSLETEVGTVDTTELGRSLEVEVGSEEETVLGALLWDMVGWRVVFSGSGTHKLSFTIPPDCLNLTRHSFTKVSLLVNVSITCASAAAAGVVTE